MVATPGAVAGVSPGSPESKCGAGSEDAVDGLVPMAADWPKVARSQATCSGANGDDIRASRLIECHSNDNE